MRLKLSKANSAVFLVEMSRGSSTALAFLLLTAIAVADWASGPEIASSILYLLPIGLMTWKRGRLGGLIVSLLSGAVWLAIEAATNEDSSWIILSWNAAVRLAVFCLVSSLIAEVLRRKRTEEHLVQIQAGLEQRVAERTAETAERAERLARSEAALQKQSSILQSVLDSMRDGVVVVNSGGEVMLANPAARNLLRLSSDSLEGRTQSKRFDEIQLFGQSENEPGVKAPLLSAMQGELVDAAEAVLPHPEFPFGISVTFTSRPLLQPSGEEPGSVIVLHDITARRELERQIAEISDREQRRLGEDLHDGLCQHLVSIAFMARKLSARLADRSLPESSDAGRIADSLGESIEQARNVARGLYLVHLEAGGLRAALEHLAAQIQSRHQIACEFREGLSGDLVEAVTVTNLFRVAQEAINNAVKHAQARHINITLFASAGMVRLTVQDDGIGFAGQQAENRGMGLQMMRHRAGMMRGLLEVASSPGSGTTVRCSVPRNLSIEEEKNVRNV